MSRFSGHAIDRYEAVVTKQLPKALRLYPLQQNGDPSFFSNKLKDKDTLHEFRYMLMAIIYTSPRTASEAFWQRIATQARNLSESVFQDLKREVLVNVAVARALDKVGIKFWWAHAEDNDIYRLTFWFMNRLFAYAAASNDGLKVMTVRPRTDILQGKHPHDMQSLANRFDATGYHFLIPNALYDPVTGEPNDQLVKKIAKLELPTIEQWHEEVEKLQPADKRAKENLARQFP